jgi:oxygen-independent coproporphyrinogen-3 oxidase
MSTFLASSFEPIECVLEKFMKDGYAQRSGDRWFLTPKGFLISNLIIGEILDSANAVQ